MASSPVVSVGCRREKQKNTRFKLDDLRLAASVGARFTEPDLRAMGAAHPVNTRAPIGAVAKYEKEPEVPDLLRSADC